MFRRFFQVVILDYKSIICAGKTFVLHLQSITEEVTLKNLICLVDRRTGEKSKTRPRFIKQDQTAIVRFTSEDVICMERFKDHPQLGRFTLRDEGRTIAVGKVLKYKPYSKGVVGASAVAEVTKKMAAANIVTVQAPVQELVYNMDDDTLAVKKPEMGAIAEGDEDDEE